MLGRICRGAAILLAIAGVIDPSISLARQARPVVSLIQTSGPPAFGDQVAAAASSSAEVVRGLTAGSAAVVVAGDRLPEVASGIDVPAFVVSPPLPSVAIETFGAPARAHLDARAPVTVAVRVRGARGATVSVALSANGVALDQAERDVPDADARLVVPLTFVPAAAGPTRLSVTARSGDMVTTADTLTTVDAQPWPIFVFDPRPSWMSTFVRRALEDDERFTVTARTVTSRSVATDTPNAPADLTNLPALARFDAVVVGAPDALTPADVSGLSAFMRRRGGAVVLLWDVRPTGPALALTGVDRWSADTRAAERPIALPGGTIRASDVSWPAQLPDRATVIGRIRETGAGAASAADPAPPVVWASPAGPGEIIVSGALDSWRYRALAQTAFDAAWRHVIATAADAAPAAIALTISPAVAGPGRHVAASVDLRDVETASGAPPAATVSMRLEATDGGAKAVVIRAWPGDHPGRFVADFEAPATPGPYRVVVSDGTAEQTADLVVDRSADEARGAERDVLAAWATSRGGRLATTDDLGQAIRQIGPAGVTGATPAPWHPMRSGWWILPVTLLTGIDWWQRRRRGLK